METGASPSSSSLSSSFSADPEATEKEGEGECAGCAWWEAEGAAGEAAEAPEDVEVDSEPDRMFAMAALASSPWLFPGGTEKEDE